MTLTLTLTGLMLQGCSGSSNPPSASPAPGLHALGVYWEVKDQAKAQTLLEAATGGVTYRIANWCRMQPDLSQPVDFSALDGEVSAALGLGYQVFLRVRVAACHSAEAMKVPGQPQTSGIPDSMPAYGQFLAALARHYAPMGVHIYGIENEVTASNFWVGTPEEYQAMLIAAGTALRTADPAALIADAGLPSVDYGYLVAAQLRDSGQSAQAVAYFNQYFARRFGGSDRQQPKLATVDDLQRALQATRANLAREWIQVEVSTFSRHLADIYQLHYYEPYQLLPQVIALIRSKVGPDVPIDAWETGFSWASVDGYTPEALAAELPALYSTMFAGGVRYAIYLQALDLPPTQNEHDRPRGLISMSGQYYPGAASFMTLARSTNSP